MSIWNFETGDLIEEEQLQQSECDELGDDEFIDADLVSLMIEGNHLVMLSIENYLSGNPDFMENLFAYEIRFYVKLNVLYCISEIFAVYILELKFMIIV